MFRGITQWGERKGDVRKNLKLNLKKNLRLRFTFFFCQFLVINLKLFRYFAVNPSRTKFVTLKTISIANSSTEKKYHTEEKNWDFFGDFVKN